MMMKSAVWLGAALAVAVLSGSSASRATVLGSAYFVPEAEAQNAVIGFAHGAPNATFTVPSPTNPACTGMFAGDTLCFNSNGSTNYTLSSFLASGGATVLTGSATDLARNLDIGTSGTIFEFTGTVSVTTGEMFQAGHDDGLQLQIGSLLVLNVPGPTGFTTTPATYTGPSGNFAFDLVYGECCGPPAALGVALPFQSAIPEPASLTVLGSALVGLAAIRRRRRQ